VGMSASMVPTTAAMGLRGATRMRRTSRGGRRKICRARTNPLSRARWARSRRPRVLSVRTNTHEAELERVRQGTSWVPSPRCVGPPKPRPSRRVEGDAGSLGIRQSTFARMTRVRDHFNFTAVYRMSVSRVAYRVLDWPILVLTISLLDRVTKRLCRLSSRRCRHGDRRGGIGSGLAR